MIVGLLLVLMTATVIFGGQKRISVITSIVVPVMALAYIAIALWTTISNIACIQTKLVWVLLLMPQQLLVFLILLNRVLYRASLCTLTLF